MCGRRLYFFIGTTSAALFVASLASAATNTGGGTGLPGHDEAILLAQIVLLLFVGRGLGEIMQRVGQPAVIGQLLAGLILGPSLFGFLWPEAHALVFPRNLEQRNLLTGFSDVGVLLLLLLTGMETDLKLVRKVGTPAFAVTGTGVVIPFVAGFTFGEFLPVSLLPQPDQRLVASLFLGTALSISSIKIVAMVVREMNFMRRNLGQIIVASAIMEDTAGWIIISLALGIAGGSNNSFVSLAVTVGGAALFLVASYTIGRPFVFWLIRSVNDLFVSDYAVITAILIVMCALSLITQGIGVNTVLGAFVAGVLVGESPILSQHIQDQLRGFITAFMMPIFFGLSGLSADLTVLKDPDFALVTVALVAIASFGKFSGAFCGGLLSGLTWREALAVGCGMNARGSTEIIVATIGLGMGVLTQSLYTMIVTTAVLTTMAMPPMLRWALRRLPMDSAEKLRLDREKLDAGSFVSQLERLLIIADKSASGKLASRLAGFIAGQKGKPVTVMHFSDVVSKDPVGGSEAAEELAKVASHSAMKGSLAASEEGDEPSAKPAISARGESGRKDDAVAAEAEKGYDLLFIGIKDMYWADGGFSADVERICAGFEGPLALTFAGARTKKARTAQLNILVPVNGTKASRHGAEIALVLSSVKETKIIALHVEEGPDIPKSNLKQANARRGIARAALRDVTAMAKRYGYRMIETVVTRKLSPAAAIITQAEQSGANLIVMGATRHIGNSLYLGQTIESVLQEWRGGLVLVVT
jgi:Kef-type K+ transport system membrane component KefB/nucleotide-binding universal stress UspA family protein